MSMLRHLYSSRCEIVRPTSTIVNGSLKLSWTKITDIPDPVLGVAGELMCRIDTVFMRPGKDAPMPIVAGRAPDRVAILFCDNTPFLKAGDRVRCLSGPVVGAFEVRSVPDFAQNMVGSHHIECQIVEIAQSAVTTAFPGAEKEV